MGAGRLLSPPATAGQCWARASKARSGSGRPRVAPLSGSGELGHLALSAAPSPQGLSRASKCHHLAILLLFGNFGSSLQMKVRLIIGCGLCIDKDMNFADTPEMRLILGAACNREITVISRP